MAQRSLGRITFDGVPKRATTNQTDPTAQRAAKSFRFQHVSTNTHEALVGYSDLNEITYEGVLAVIEPPNAAIPKPFYESPVVDRSDTTDMATIYVTGTIGESVDATYTE